MRVCILLLFLLSVSCVHRQEPFVHHVTTTEKPWTHEAFKNDPEAFQFAILTDRTGGMREGVFASAVNKVNSIQPEFVVSVGDYITGYTSNRAQVTTEWEEMDQITAGFEMPFFFLPGNHDITNPEMRAIYEERLGRRYYSFVYKDVLFLCLDTQDRPVAEDLRVIQDAGLLPEQVEWAQAVLKDHGDVRWTFVLMHQPLWLHDANSRWPEIESALGDRDYTVFAGHVHRYTKYVRQERNYYVLATTGGGSRLRGPAYGEFDHAVWVTMAQEGPRIANLLLDGIRSEDVHTEHTAAFRNALRVNYTTDPAEQSITGTLRISNPFHHPLTVTETWADTTGWKVGTTIDSVPILPGDEKTYTIEVRYEPGADLSNIPQLSLGCVAGSELNGIFPLDGLPQAYLAALRPHLRLPRLAQPPTLDGTIDEGEWAGAATIETMMKLEAPTPAEDEATAWYGYDSEYFYLAGHFVQDPDELRLECTDPGHPLWEDDSIELFFDANRDEKTYGQALITANNVRRAVNLNTLETATGRTDDAWTVEVRIPWASMGLTEVSPGTSIGFNLRRNRAAGEQRRVSEWTSTLSANPHTLELLGILEIE